MLRRLFSPLRTTPTAAAAATTPSPSSPAVDADGEDATTATTTTTPSSPQLISHDEAAYLSTPPRHHGKGDVTTGDLSLQKEQQQQLQQQQQQNNNNGSDDNIGIIGISKTTTTNAENVGDDDEDDEDVFLIVSPPPSTTTTVKSEGGGGGETNNNANRGGGGGGSVTLPTSNGNNGNNAHASAFKTFVHKLLSGGGGGSNSGGSRGNSSESSNGSSPGGGGMRGGNNNSSGKEKEEMGGERDGESGDASAASCSHDAPVVVPEINGEGCGSSNPGENDKQVGEVGTKEKVEKATTMISENCISNWNGMDQLGESHAGGDVDDNIDIIINSSSICGGGNTTTSPSPPTPTTTSPKNHPQQPESFISNSNSQCKQQQQPNLLQHEEGDEDSLQLRSVLVSEELIRKDCHDDEGQQNNNHSQKDNCSSSSSIIATAEVTNSEADANAIPQPRATTTTPDPAILNQVGLLRESAEQRKSSSEGSSVAAHDIDDPGERDSGLLQLEQLLPLEKGDDDKSGCSTGGTGETAATLTVTATNYTTTGTGTTRTHECASLECYCAAATAAGERCNISNVSKCVVGEVGDGSLCYYNSDTSGSSNPGEGDDEIDKVVVGSHITSASCGDLNTCNNSTSSSNSNAAAVVLTSPSSLDINKRIIGEKDYDYDYDSSSNGIVNQEGAEKKEVEEKVDGDISHKQGKSGESLTGEEEFSHYYSNNYWRVGVEQFFIAGAVTSSFETSPSSIVGESGGALEEKVVERVNDDNENPAVEVIMGNQSSNANHGGGANNASGGGGTTATTSKGKDDAATTAAAVTGGGSSSATTTAATKKGKGLGGSRLSLSRLSFGQGNKNKQNKENLKKSGGGGSKNGSATGVDELDHATDDTQVTLSGLEVISQQQQQEDEEEEEQQPVVFTKSGVSSHPPPLINPILDSNPIAEGEEGDSSPESLSSSVYVSVRTCQSGHGEEEGEEDEEFASFVTGNDDISAISSTGALVLTSASSFKSLQNQQSKTTYSSYSSTTTLNDVNSSAVFFNNGDEEGGGDGGDLTDNDGDYYYNTDEDDDYEDDDDDESNTLRDTDSLVVDGCCDNNTEMIGGSSNINNKASGGGGVTGKLGGSNTQQPFTIQRRRKVELKRVQSGSGGADNDGGGSNINNKASSNNNNNQNGNGGGGGAQSSTTPSHLLSPPRRTPSQYAYSNSITEIPSLQNNVLRKVASLTLNTSSGNKKGGSGNAAGAGGGTGGVRTKRKVVATNSGGGGGDGDDVTLLGSELLEWFTKSGGGGGGDETSELGVKCCELLCSIGVLERVAAVKEGAKSGSASKGNSKGVQQAPQQQQQSGPVVFDPTALYKWTNGRGSSSRNAIINSSSCKQQQQQPDDKSNKNVTSKISKDEQQQQQQQQKDESAATGKGGTENGGCTDQQNSEEVFQNTTTNSSSTPNFQTRHLSLSEDIRILHHQSPSPQSSSMIKSSTTSLCQFPPTTPQQQQKLLSMMISPEHLPEPGTVPKQIEHFESEIDLMSRSLCCSLGGSSMGSLSSVFNLGGGGGLGGGENEKLMLAAAFSEGVVAEAARVLREAIQNLTIDDDPTKKKLDDNDTNKESQIIQNGEALPPSDLKAPSSTTDKPALVTVTDRKVFELRGELETVIHKYKVRVEELERRVRELEQGEKDGKVTSTSAPPPPPPPMPGMMAGPPPPPPPPMPGMAAGPPPPPPPPMPGMAAGPPPPPPPPMPGMGGPPPPPPPPMPGMGGPPPPPPPPGMGGGPPPPPPPPGSGPPLLSGNNNLNAPPPPPPLSSSGPAPFPPAPPGLFGATTQARPAPRKQPVTPAVPMKPLYWTRIQLRVPPPTTAPSPTPPPPVAVAATVVDSSSTTAPPPTSPSKSPTPQQKLWEKLEEIPVDSFEDFTDLFSRQVVERKLKRKDEDEDDSSDGKRKKKQPKVTYAKLLDSKRSQNVGILVKSLNLDIESVRVAVMEFDLSCIDLETVEKVYESRPTPDELTILTDHVQSTPQIPLDKPDQFVYDLSTIPNFSDRIVCLTFTCTFFENLINITTKLSNLRLVCNQLMNSGELKTILALILTYGNYMNGGNMQRGQADGFSLDILGKLRDVKSKDSSVTLLHYIVRAFMREVEKNAGGDEGKSKESGGKGDAKSPDPNKDGTAKPDANVVTLLPIPEPSDVERASQINFDEVDAEVNKLKRDLESCTARVQKVLTADPSTAEPFQTKMKEFIEKAEKDLAELVETFSETEGTFKSTLQFYEFSPKKREQGTSEFFSLWIAFCNDFKTIWRNEQQRVLKERCKEAERVVKAKRGNLLGFIVKKPKEAGGLKERFKKKMMKESD